MNWTVKGERLIERVVEDDVIETERWEPFEDTFAGETKAEARWKARRRFALGKSLGKLEAEPVNAERLRVEVAAGETPVDVDEPSQERSGSAQAEYDRLTETVRIESVKEAK